MNIRQATISDLDQLSILFAQYRVFYKQPFEPGEAKQFLAERFKVEESIIEFTNKEPIPIDKDKIDQAVEKLKLKRNKPLIKSSQTLEDFMNIKYC